MNIFKRNPGGLKINGNNSINNDKLLRGPLLSNRCLRPNDNLDKIQKLQGFKKVLADQQKLMNSNGQNKIIQNMRSKDW